MPAHPELPICQKCQKPVNEFSVGKQFLRGNICYFESKCHGETDRVEYWPKTVEAAVFKPQQAFPSDRPPQDLLADAPEPGSNRHPLAIQEELFAMPEWKTLSRIRHFAASLKLFRTNAGELRNVLNLMTTGPEAFALTSVRNRAHLDAAMDEAIRLLHNFVAAAMSLVDHSRVFYGDMYKSAGTFPDYTEQVETRFVKNQDIQFVNCLRQFSQHYKLPQISTNLHAVNGKSLSIQLVLHKDDLETFSGWNSHAKKYLAQAPAEIDLMNVVDTYEAAIVDFYQWLESRQRVIHSADLAAVEAKQKEAITSLAAEMPALLDGAIELYRRGLGSLTDVFAVALGPGDYPELSELEADLQKWVDSALERIEKKFGCLPPKLVARLRDCASVASIRGGGDSEASRQL